MMNGLNKKAIALAATLQSVYLARIRPKLVEERGDTNFISILIILGIVIGLATLFIKFGDNIVQQVNGIVSGFTLKNFGG